tara:strand:+ start:91 stop:810 length:720 start_codon:yes stop_codon:yes gene_type:complete
MSAQIFYNNGSSSSEIITHLINSTDGAGLHFDGTSGTVALAAPPPNLGTKFSFELVIQADEWNTSSNQHFLVDFGSSGRFIFGTKYPMTGELGIQVISTWSSFDTNPKILDDLKVHHLVLAVDGTTVLLYDNGNLVGTASIASPTLDLAANAAIGSSYGGSAQFFNGTIYRARLWNKTLEQTDVTSVYESASLDYADQWGVRRIKSTRRLTSILGLPQLRKRNLTMGDIHFGGEKLPPR